MNRGDIWTAAGGPHYTGKPRTVLIVQDDRFDATSSVTICPLTTDPTEIPLLRIPLEPNHETGLSQPSSIMVDKLTTMPRATLDQHLGTAPESSLLALSRSLIVFLGIT